MVEPLNALLIAGAVAAVACVLFWPEWGLLWRRRRLRRMTERVLIEDALKHLYDCESRRQAPTVNSLSGALEVSGDRAADLLARIETMGLGKSEEGAVRLTSEGRRYALRIIRTHRLWERHLAEKTGLNEAEWHSDAEYQEHVLSPEEVDFLSEQMGHPRYDPHGDPIPTSSGDIVPQKGQPLSSLPVGELGVIVHVEDEPKAVFAQLLAEGLRLGMRVQVDEVTPERICFWADGDEHVLAPVVAANISTVPLPREQEMAGPFETLAGLGQGEVGRVLGISRACRGLERRRLMDLGIVPGTAVEAEMKSASGDPTAYRVRGSLVALRKEQAEQIHITRQTEAA